MPIDPNQIQWDETPQINAEQVQWDSEPEAEATFKEKMMTYGKELGRQLGLTGRYLEEGVASAIGTVVDPITYGLTRIPAYRETFGDYQSVRDAVSKGLTDLGVPEPENAAEKIIGEISTAVAAAGTGAGAAGAIAGRTGGAVKQAAKMMAAQPEQQIGGAVGAEVGQQAAEEADLGAVGQTAAAIGGSILGAGAAGAPRVTIGAKQVPEGMVEAEKRGIRTFTQDIDKPKTAGGKILKTTTEMLLGGQGLPRAKQQAERIEAIKDIARQYDAERVTPFIDDVYKELDKNWQNRLNKFWKAKSGVIEKLDQKGRVNVDRTTAAINNEIAILMADSPKGNAKLIKQFEQFRDDLQNKGLVLIEKARKRLGDNLSQKQSLAEHRDEGEKIARRIYTKLNEDMGSFIKDKGGKNDFTQWKVGNKGIQKLNENLRYKTLNSVLKTGRQNPEDITKLLLSNKSSNNKILYNNLSKQGRQNARQALIKKAFDDAGGMDDLSPDRFKNNLKKIQQQVGIFFKGTEKAEVEGLYKALKFTEGAGKGTAEVRTGERAMQLLSVMIGGFTGSQVGGGVGAAVGAAAIPATLGGMARLYNSAPMKRALIQLSRVKSGSPEEAKIVKRMINVIQATKQEESTP